MSLGKMSLLLASIAVSGAVLAAPAPATMPTNWAGYYAGVEMGKAWANENYYIYTGQPLVNANLSAFVGGLFIGKYWQANHLVWGIETGLDGAGLRHYDKNIFDGGNGHLTMEWFYTLTPQIGYACHHWLFDAKLGLAITNLNQQYLIGNVPVTQENHDETGMDAGVGVNYQLNRWVFGLGYDYMYFGTADLFIGEIHVKNTANLGRARVSYRFAQ
jgi:opacity protein-like surface antigen